MTFQGKLSAASIIWLLGASGMVFLLSAHESPTMAFQPSGQYAETVVGQPDFLSAGSSATANTLDSPFRLTFDSAGDLWVADEANHRVMEFDPPFTDGMAASLVVGKSNFTSNSPETTQSGTSEVAGVSFDSQGDLWVSDWSNNRVLEFKPPFSTGMNASLELGQPPGRDEFNVSTAAQHPPGDFVNPHYSNEMAAPVATVFDASGDLWVTDRANNRILEFKPPFISGMNATSVLGQANVTSYEFTKTPTARSLFGPQSATFDSQGDLWVSDQNDNRVLEFAASSLGTDDPSAILELGQPAGPYEFSNNTAGDTPTSLHGPAGMAFDGQGDLWVVDKDNNRVLEFKPPFTDGEAASLVIGQGNGATAFVSGAAATNQTGLNNPLALAFDSDGNLWVSDQDNNRILEFSAAAIQTAGTTTSVDNVTGASASPAGGGLTCSQIGTGSLCHMTVSQTAPNVRLDATGQPYQNTTNLYSSYLGSSPPAGDGSPPISAGSYYEFYLTGLDNGTARFCVGSSGTEADMSYYSGGSWSVPSDVSVSADSTCGTLPLSAASTGRVILAVSGGVGSGGQTGEQLGSAARFAEGLVLIGALVGGVVTLIRRHNRVGVGNEDDQDEGLDEWI